MDEPLSNLDAKLRLYTRAEIKRLHSQIGVTTIYVTHDQAEAMSMADKIAVINKGKVVQYDTPAAIYDTPADVFVANFVGSPPMNLVKASVTHKDHGLALVADGFKYEVPESMVGPVRRASDREVLMGIRPESMILSEDQTPESLFEAEVYLCEPQGSNTVINLKVGNDILKSVVQGKFRATVGAKVWVSLPGEQVQVFDSQSGLRLA
jgi:multiple sugar transport system ATP-binding protein